jgi:glycosyltransferase involved in cell wall biosynthesis
VYELPNPSGKAKMKNLLCKTLLQQKFPMQVSLFWDEKIKDRIDSILSEEKPDYVIADLIRTTEYLKDFPGYKMADLQDLFSLRYERQIKMDLATLNPYGAYLFRLPGFIQKILSITFIKKAVMKAEIKLLKKYEKQIGKQYNRIMFVAKNEGEKYNQMLGEKKALVTPLGVDYEQFSEKLNVRKIPNSIAFMGALNVAHNENGITYFAKKVFPLVQKTIPEAKLYIIGGGVTDTVKKLASDNSYTYWSGRRCPCGNFIM